MHFKFAAVAVLMSFGLSACYDPPPPSNAANGPSRVAPSSMSHSPYRVAELHVTVPQSLVVSEENSYKPAGDIVWRGDPFGNRHQQVHDVVYDGLSRGAAQIHGATPVRVDVQVARFHALTERTRYSLGGTHSIYFIMTLRDPASGNIIDGPWMVDGSLEAFGGDAAIAAESRGLTQKVRISGYLSQVIRRQLGQIVEIDANDS